MRIAIAQTALAAGAAQGAHTILAAVAGARSAGAALLATGARAVCATAGGTGAPTSSSALLDRVAAATQAMVVVVGLEGTSIGGAGGEAAFAVAAGGDWRAVERATPRAEDASRSGCADAAERSQEAGSAANLPPGSALVDLDGVRAGILDGAAWEIDGTAEAVVGAGARVLVVAGCSPWEVGVHAAREARLAERVREVKVPLVWVNTIGADGAAVYDGASLVVGADGRIAQRLPAWHATLALVRFDGGSPRPVRAQLDPSQARHLLQAAASAIAAFAARSGAEPAIRGGGGAMAHLAALLAADAEAARVPPGNEARSGSSRPAAEVVLLAGERFAATSRGPGRLELRIPPELAAEAVEARERMGVALARRAR